MTGRVISWVVVALCLFASPVRAQFANHSIGLSFGYMKLSSVSQSPEGNAPALDWGLPIGLYGTSYLGDGWDLTYHVLQAMVLTDKVLGRQYLGIAPSFGGRYLFSEEFFRPYLGVDL